MRPTKRPKPNSASSERHGRDQPLGFTLRALRWTFTLTLALGLSAPAHAEIDRAVLLGLSGSVLRVEVVRAQGGYSLGTGVVIAPQRVVTNCHVTHDALRISVLRSGARWPVAAQRSDIDHDLCLLRVPGLEAGAVALGQANRLRPGQPVLALGYSGGMSLQHSDGEVIALHRHDGSRVIQSSNWFNSGASGGGLFDADLHLVGILTFRLRGAQAHYFAAPAEWLQTLLDAHDLDGEREVAPERSTQLPYWQRPAPDQPRFLAAAQLLLDDDWPELEALSAQWVRSDAADPEPWYLMGVALAGMNRAAEAQHALECALALEPASAAAQASLALLQRPHPDTAPATSLAAAAAPCVAN